MGDFAPQGELKTGQNRNKQAQSVLPANQRLEQHVLELVDKNIKTTGNDFARFASEHMGTLKIVPGLEKSVVRSSKTTGKLRVNFELTKEDAENDAKVLRLVVHNLTHGYLIFKGQMDSEASAVKTSIPYLEAVQKQIEKNYGMMSRVNEEFRRLVIKEKYRVTAGGVGEELK